MKCIDQMPSPLKPQERESAGSGGAFRLTPCRRPAAGAGAGKDGHEDRQRHQGEVRIHPGAEVGRGGFLVVW